MKYLLLILAILIALPSAQAGVCGMGGMQDSIEQASEGHDCCPDEGVDEAPAEQPCEGGSHCAGCIITVAVVPLSLEAAAHQLPHADFTVPMAQLVPSHSAPPYRPPIA